MNDLRMQALELSDQADNLPYSSTKVALLEEAVQLADSVNDDAFSFSLRNELMAAAAFSGRSDVMLVAFSWCLAAYDRSPESFDLATLLWKYKWVVDHAYSFPEISRARLEALLADMERRYREAGSTMHAVEYMRRRLMMRLGDVQQSRAAHKALRLCPRDELSDCPACVANSDCFYYAAQRRWRLAVKAAEPVLKNRLSCAEEPHCVLARVLRSLLHLGRIEEATAYQKQGYKLVHRGAQFVGQHADHLQFLAIVGNLPQAKHVVEHNLAGALESIKAEERFDFLLAARLWTDRLTERGIHRILVRLPESLPRPADNGESDVRELGAWFTAQAQDLARRFDARNGTTRFQQQLDELPELLRLAN